MDKFEKQQIALLMKQVQERKIIEANCTLRTIMNKKIKDKYKRCSK